MQFRVFILALSVTYGATSPRVRGSSHFFDSLKTLQVYRFVSANESPKSAPLPAVILLVPHKIPRNREAR